MATGVTSDFRRLAQDRLRQPGEGVLADGNAGGDTDDGRARSSRTRERTGSRGVIEVAHCPDMQIEQACKRQTGIGRLLWRHPSRSGRTWSAGLRPRSGRPVHEPGSGTTVWTIDASSIS